MKRTIGTKAAVTTLAIKAGLVDRVDGEIFSPATLYTDLARILEEKGYKMDPRKAVVKVKAFSKRKHDECYTNFGVDY
jgi:hypothetical protein